MEVGLEKKVVFSGKLLALEVHQVKLPNGTEGVREVVRHPGAVVVVPRLQDGRWVLVKQFRFAVGETLLEFPAGTLKSGESPESCAARELAEETGFRGKLMFLGRFYSAPGFCNEELFCFLAEDLVPGEARPDSDEILELVTYSEQEVAAAILQGTMRDAKSLASWTLLGLKGHHLSGTV